jgi:streptogramin lyase
MTRAGSSDTAWGSTSSDLDAEPLGITLGPDGNLWFTEYEGHSIDAHDLP